MNEEIEKKIREAADLIKADGRYGKLQASLEEYERCEELNEMVKEYNTEQDLIISKVGDDEGRAVVQARIEELFEKITAHPVYIEYIRAKGEFEKLMNDVYGQLQYAVTGQRPCTHDCSTCGGCG